MYVNYGSPLKGLEPPKRSSRSKVVWTIVLITAVCGTTFLFLRSKSEPAEEIVPAVCQLPDQEDQINETLEGCTVSTGDIPAELFSAYGKFDANDTAAILLAAKDIYDFTNVKIGRDLRFYFNGEERAKRMEYDRDTETMVIVERNVDDFSVHEEKIPYEVSQKFVHATIDNFLYADALDAGLSEPTVLEIGDIFSFDIDFTTEIRQGDEFTVIYEKRTRNKQPAPDGRILGAKFVNEGKAYYAYYFDNDGRGGYYDSEGHVLEKQFLRAPLSYRHISSGYTGSRLNPITRTVSAHYQIDYAAPIGTPVVSTARGTVTSVGWENGWGNMVRIRHDNGYTTHYGHLSAFAKGVRTGANVSQGQVVGYVGSTGWSTGPHLDYGMRLSGSPVNPLSLKLPKGKPLGEDKMDAFEKVKSLYNELLQ